MNLKERELIEFDALCSSLSQLVVGDDCECYRAETHLNSIPIEKRIPMFFNVVSLNHSYEMKSITLSKLKSTFSSWFTEKHISKFIIKESKAFIVGLMIDEKDVAHQEELVSLCGIIIEIINQDEINKWEVISEVVFGCLTSNKKILETQLLDLFIKSPKLFGKDVNEQVSQYNKFFETSLRGFSENTKVAIFALDVLKKLPFKYMNILCDRSNTDLSPLILAAIEAIVVTSDALLFMNSVCDVTTYCFGLFSKCFPRTIRVINNLLYNTTIEKHVVSKIYFWISLVMYYCGMNLNRKNESYILIVFKNIINLAIESYPCNADDWFKNDLMECDKFLSVQDVGAQLVFSEVFRTFKKEFLYPFLSSKAEELLKSSDWRQNAIAIDCLEIIVSNYGEDISDPFEIFETIKPYFSSKNIKILYSTIKLCQALCLLLYEENFAEFHRNVLFLISENAACHNHLQFKLKVIDIVACIIFRCYGDNYSIKSCGIIQLFLDVMDAVLKSDDNELMGRMTRLLDQNIRYMYDMVGDKANTYTYKMVDKLLKMFDKLFFISFSNNSIHNVVTCLEEIVTHHSSDDLENVISLIVTYMDDFNKSHNLSSSHLEIQPCFFPFITIVAEYKTKCLAQLLSKLGPSLVRYLTALKQCYVESQERNDSRYLNQCSYGCSFCLKRGCINGIIIVCRLVTALVENYANRFSPFVSVYLDIMEEILISTKEEHNYDFIVEGIYRLIKCAVIYGDTKTIKNRWETCLKNTLFTIMKSFKSRYVFLTFKYFNKCVTISKFDNALKPGDVKSVGNILNNAIVIYMNIIRENFPSKENESENFSLSSEKEDQSSLSYYSIPCEYEEDLDDLKMHVLSLLKVYGGMMIDAIIPMFKTIFHNLPSKRFEMFFRFLLAILADIFDAVDSTSIEKSDLLHVGLDFVLALLPKCAEYYMNDVISIVINFQVMFPVAFNEHLEKLDQLTRSKIEKLLTK